MAHGHEDFVTEVTTSLVEAASFRSGLDADKPASPAAGDIWLARDTYKLYCCMVAGAWMDLGYWRDDVTQTVQTGSRAIDGTVYHNTSGKIRVVHVAAYSNPVATWCQLTMDAYCDANAAPTTFIAEAGETYSHASLQGTAYASMTFLVPPGYYYKVGTIGSPGYALHVWTEWDLH
jgi:hypothetical protein